MFSQSFSPGSGFGISVSEYGQFSDKPEPSGDFDPPKEPRDIRRPPAARNIEVRDRPGTTMAKASGKWHGDPRWHSERDVSDPKAEAKEGADLMDNDTEHDADANDGTRVRYGGDDSDDTTRVNGDYDDVDTTSFLKALDQDSADGCNKEGTDLNACGYHLAAARLSHCSGDYQQSFKSINAAMHHFKAFHQAMKAGLEGR